MNTTRMNSWMAVGLSVLMLAGMSGCATRKSRDGAGGGLGDYGMGQGEMITGDGWDSGPGIAMDGARFDTLPPVEGVRYEPVYFAYDNYQIPPAEYRKIDAVAEFLRLNNNVVLVVEGHCDERGTIEYNISLGEYRAQSVRSYLLSIGVAPDRVQTASFGKEKPAVIGSGESVWRLNRRAEFALYRR